MKSFLWDRSYHTGLETVDVQHHRFVHLINRVGASLSEAPDGGAMVQATFAELADYAQFHFSDEEELMLKARLDLRHVERHCENHRRFAEQLAGMWSSRKSLADPAEVLHGFMAGWLGYHILAEDQSMARQLARIEAGESPAKAYEFEETARDNVAAALVAALDGLYQALSQHITALGAANLDLERTVLERTAQLTNTNEALVQANARLERISLIDGLLGIANRRMFDSTLEKEWRRAAREKKPLALLMIDVDHFKTYNDTYGHQAGDLCLQTIAKRCASAVNRAADLAARYGGEELAVILPNTELEGAERLARNILSQVAQLRLPHRSSRVADHLTVSIGVAAMVPREDVGAGDLITAADRALYAAKTGGRNRVSA